MLTQLASSRRNKCSRLVVLSNMTGVHERKFSHARPWRQSPNSWRKRKQIETNPLDHFDVFIAYGMSEVGRSWGWAEPNVTASPASDIRHHLTEENYLMGPNRFYFTIYDFIDGIASHCQVCYNKSWGYSGRNMKPRWYL